MPSDAVRLWWLYGPACAGKSVTAWELYAHLLPGRPRAYFDVDQVGMCYPEHAGDPGRYALKARAAGALVRRLTAAGARTVVVSGVLDQRSLHEVVAEADGVQVTFCRMRVRPEELTRRLRARYNSDMVVRVLAEAQQWDQYASEHPVVDTDEGTPLAAAQRALELIKAVRAPEHSAPPTPRPASAPTLAGSPGVALLICGPTAVGKSTVGFGLFMHLLGLGRASAYLDLQQLSFLSDVRLDNSGTPDAGGHQLTASCVADLWSEYRKVGARNLVLTGHVESQQDVDRYRTALGSTPLVLCRLRASSEHIRERILSRGGGTGPQLSGDALIGLSAREVDTVLQRAITEQDHLNTIKLGDVVLDTDGLSPENAVARLAEALEHAVDDPRAP